MTFAVEIVESNNPVRYVVRKSSPRKPPPFQSSAHAKAKKPVISPLPNHKIGRR
jgi:hypothetical protein